MYNICNNEVKQLQIERIDKERYGYDITALSMYAFQYTLVGEKLEEKIAELQDQEVLGIFDNEKIAAKVQIRDLHIFQNDKVIKMGGIQSVATYPEYRRQGYVKKLLIAALKEMREMGYLVSMLHPFSIHFYRKFGYEILSDQQQLVLTQADLKPLPAENQNGKIRRFNQNEYHEDLMSVYEQYAKKHNGMLKRTKKWWQAYIIKERTAAIYYDENNQARGYILYDIANQKMTVKELIVTNQSARIALWNFICQHDSMLDEIVLHLSKHEQLTYLINNPQQNIITSPYFMVRIVNVEKYLQQYPFHICQEEFIFYVSDDCAPWNQGYYKIANGSVEKLNEQVQSEKIVELTIQTLSTVLFGYKTVEELSEIGKIHGDEQLIQLMNQLIPKQKTYFPDFY